MSIKDNISSLTPDKQAKALELMRKKGLSASKAIKQVLTAEKTKK